MFFNSIRKNHYISICGLALFLILLSAAGLNAQVTKRTEIGQDKDFDDRNVVIPLRDHGLIYMSASDKLEKMKVDYYSTDLVKTGSQSFRADRNTYYYNTEFSHDTAYSMFLNDNGFYSILKTDLGSMKSTCVSGLLPDKTYITQFVILGNYCYVRGFVGKEDVILQINLLKKKVKILPIQIPNYRPNKVFPQDLQVINDELLLFVNVENDKRDLDLLMVRLDKEGKIKSTTDISQGMPAKIVRANIDMLNGKVMITGTCSHTRHNYSQGAFIGELRGDEILFPEFYSFIDMKSFNLQFSDRAQKAIERKQANAADDNKTLVINTQALVHDLVPAKRGYYVLMEFYQTIYNKGMVVGYFTTHGIVLKFDEFGKLEWDGGIEMQLTSPTLYQWLSASESAAGDITIAYSEGDHILSRIYGEDGKLKAENDLDLEKADGQFVKNARRTRAFIQPWYENNLITWGVQVVKGSDKGKIFFIDKVSMNK